MSNIDTALVCIHKYIVPLFDVNHSETSMTNAEVRPVKLEGIMSVRKGHCLGCMCVCLMGGIIKAV